MIFHINYLRKFTKPRLTLSDLQDFSPAVLHRMLLESILKKISYNLFFRSPEVILHCQGRDTAAKRMRSFVDVMYIHMYCSK